MTNGENRSVRLRALGAVSTMALGMTMMLTPAQAQQAAAETTLGVVKVQSQAIDPNPNAEPGVPYKAKYSGDERNTRPIAETPKTITVLTKAQIDDAGYTDMAQILDAQPGITIGTGENGNAFGDRYIIRGQEAKSDTFVDGLRDPGMTIRESFAIEQLEISKGPSSSFGGRGTSGGAINAITKVATTDYDFTKFSAGFGTDLYRRFTVDTNYAIGEKFAVRANVLYSYTDVPGRAPANRERQGIALSGLYQVSDATQIVVDYYGLKAKDNPDVGSYLSGAGNDRFPVSPLPPVFAQGADFIKSNVHTGTARIKHKFNDEWRISSTLRAAGAFNGYVISGANGTTTNVRNPGGVYTTAAISSHQGWQDVNYVANQTNLFWSPTLGGMKHEFILTGEYSSHSVRNGVYNVTNSGQNCSTGTATTLNAFCITNANGTPVSNLRNLLNRQIVKANFDLDWEVNTASVGLMDTVSLNDQFTVFGGVRLDSFDYRLTTQNTTTLAQVNYPYSDTLFNGHFGLVYQFSPIGNVYASFSTGQDINGGESDVGTSSGYGGVVIFNGSVAGAKPETSLNFEIGTKWNVFDDRLLATAALFQTTKTDVMEGADYLSFGTFNTGENKVEGVEFGVTGMLTDDLTVSSGLTLMNSEVLKSATPANVGKTLANFAKSSANILAKYRLTEDATVGGAFKYESRRFGGQPDTATPFAVATGIYSQPVPAYSVVDLFASYRVNDNLSARLNVNNVGDVNYYLAAYRAGFFLYKGDARSVKITLDYAL
ncbi:MAG: hypothetical protein RL274_1022 [Pseudomonadota bacterium]|jgi:catecholate siderophore receptor